MNDDPFMRATIKQLRQIVMTDLERALVGRIENLIAERDALIRALPAVQPRVKPLEWREISGFEDRWFADADIGVYSVSDPTGRGRWRWQWHIHNPDRDWGVLLDQSNPELARAFPTREDAIAAVEGHRKARILAALNLRKEVMPDAAPSPPAGHDIGPGDAVAGAAQDAILYGTGFMQGGKHVPMEDVLAAPPPWPWNLIHLTNTHDLHCTTEGCGRRVSLRFESNGISSDYCEPCGRRVAALAQKGTTMRDTMPEIAEAFPDTIQIFRRDRKMTFGDHVNHDPNDWQVYIRADAVQAQIDSAVKAERERCAKVAEACPDSHWGPWVAAAICNGDQP